MIEFAPVTRLGLLLVRPGFLVMAVPAFGSGFAPPVVRIGLMVALSLLLMPFVALPDQLPPAGLAVVVAREAIIGLALAMAVRVLIAATELAGNAMGFNMGFFLAAVVDPQSGVQNKVLSAAYATFALVVFFAIDGHHAVLRALAASYDILPVGIGRIDGPIAAIVGRLLGVVFLLGVQLAAPVLVVLFVVELALGLMSRLAPQMNLMMLGMPLRVAIGLTVMASTLHLVPRLLASTLGTTLELSERLARAFQ